MALFLLRKIRRWDFVLAPFAPMTFRSDCAILGTPKLSHPRVQPAKALPFSVARGMHIPLNMKTLSQIQGERIRAEMKAVRAAMTVLAIRAAAQLNGKVGV